MSGPETWWRQGDALDRFLGDLVAGELARLRPGAVLPRRPWPREQSLLEGDLACDSLELLNLAAALAEALETHRAGVEDCLLARRTLAEWAEVAAAGLERFSAVLAFRTSGSTCAPKTVRHPLKGLVEEVEALAAIFPGRRRVLSAVPAHHIYGFLFTVLLPQKLGASVLDVRAHSPAGVRAHLREGDLLVAHPAFWGAFARAGDSAPVDVFGVTSTAPCPPETSRLAVSSGLARLVEVYGCTETAGVGWRDAPDAAFQLLPHWRPGAEPFSLLRVSRDGEAAQAQVPDRLAWTDERSFRVEGRRDEAVQVGGVNVFPSEVRAKLLGHPQVRDAAVRLMRPGEGARLKAFIVPRELSDDPVELRRELAGWCDTRLSAPERPKAFSFGPALPRGALGKLADWPLFEAAE
jgi:4-coumarate--CoA ligase (photoactive yellow protein activation family)